MTTPDKTHIYGNIAKESGGFALAEMVSMGTSLGVVAIADQVAPNLLKSASKVVSKICVEPFLDTIEGALGSVCRIKECQPDKTKPREERAENLAKTLIVFSAAWVASMAAKLATRRAFNTLVGVHEAGPAKGKLLSNNEWRILLADEGVHYGSLLLMNTVAAPVTDEMITSTSNVLKKCGMSERKAKEVASMAVIWELPNLLGMGAGIAAIAKNHLGGHSTSAGSHVERLLQSRAAAEAFSPNLKTT